MQSPAGSFSELLELHLTINLRPVPGAKKEYVTPTVGPTWLEAFGRLPALEHLDLEICAGYESTPNANTAAVNTFVPGAWQYISTLKTLKQFEFDLTCIPDAQADGIVWATLANTLQALPQLEKVCFAVDPLRTTLLVVPIEKISVFRLRDFGLPWGLLGTNSCLLSLPPKESSSGIVCTSV
jgi:hypothetical protein